MSTDLLASLIQTCRDAEVQSVYASTQYGMGFLVASDGPNGGGIVFRDDKIPHADRVKMADQLNAELARTPASYVP